MATSSSSPAVLVVDQSQSATTAIRTLLKQMGHENVDEVHDGESALKRARTKRYAWIISELNLHAVDGITLLKKLRAEQGERVPRFVFVTGESNWSSQATARQLGAHAFIQKPRRPVALKERIEAVFGAAGRGSAQLRAARA